MALGFFLFSFISILFCIGIILCVFSIILFRKRKFVYSIICLLVGLLFICPIIVSSINFIYNNRANDYGSPTSEDFIKEYEQLNKEFYEIYKVEKEEIFGISITINGFINGKGKLIIIPQPDDENKVIQLELDGEISKAINSRNWVASECIIHFIPENELVSGKLKVDIRIY